MSEQARIITEEEWEEYKTLKEQVELLKSVLLKVNPDYKDWIDKNFS